MTDLVRPAHSAIVIEDDPVQSLVLCHALVRAGFNCRTARDGWVGVRALESEPADLAVIDMVMPRMNGAETIIAIRARWPNTKIVAISSGASNLDPTYILQHCAGLSPDLSFHKPFPIERLVQASRELLQPTRVRRAG